MRKKYKILLFIISLLLLLVVGFSIYMKYFYETKEVTNTTSVVHKIEKFGYTLDDRDSELLKNEFYILEDILKDEEIDYLEYAKSISKLFIIDLYTIENKINKYDIGGIEYISKEEQSKFKNIILDSIYESVLDNSYHDRNQELPSVKNVTINEINEIEFELKKEMVDAYLVNISWEYKDDLGYDNNALITLVRDDEKLFIAEYKPIIEED